ncbi:MAG: glycoside hydrolase family 55 protein [Ferruginibacter sp.]
MKLSGFLTITAVICFTTMNCLAGVFNVKKYGAKGDGKTDDTKAIQAAIDAAPANMQSVIYFPKGTYMLRSYTVTKNYLENYFILVHSNISFKGAGKTSVIRLGSHLFDKNDINATAQLFYGNNIQNLSFSNLVIDMNGANNLVPAGTLKNQRAIFINHGSNATIDNITIKNNSGRNMIMFAGKGNKVLVKNSTFLNGGHYVGSPTENKNQTDFSFIYFEWDSSWVINNRIEQQNIDIALGGITGGTELHGSYCYATGNKIIGCSPGIYVSSSWYDTKNTTVEKNNFINCTKGVSFWVNYHMDSISIKDNFIQLTGYRGWKDYVSAGILMPNGNTTAYDFKYANANSVKNLLISGNTIIAPAGETSSRTAGMVLHSLYDCTITGNSISGMNFGGVIIQGSKWGTSSVMINKNKFTDFKNNVDTLFPAGYVVVFDSYLMQFTGAPGIKNIVVSDNSFTRSANNITAATRNKTSKKGDFFGAYIALPDAMQKEVAFKQNVFSDKTETIKLRSINPKR